MANLSTRELFEKLRAKFVADAGLDAIELFDKAVTDTLFDLVDGASPEPPKRKYTRKKKTATPPTNDPSLKFPA